MHVYPGTDGAVMFSETPVTFSGIVKIFTSELRLNSSRRRQMARQSPMCQLHELPTAGLACISKSVSDFKCRSIATAHPAAIYRHAWIQLFAGSAYSAVVEQHDWPLMAVFLVAVLSITLILQELRAAAGLLTRLYLRLRVRRKTRLLNSLVSEGKQTAPASLESVAPSGR